MSNTNKQPPIRLDLPFPRLELVFEDIDNDPRNKGRWTHRLILQHLEGHAYALEIGTTLCGSGSDWYCKGDDWELPFRAGAQIQWDQWHLRIPAFAIYKDQWRPIDSRNNKWLAGVIRLNKNVKPTPEGEDNEDN